MGGRAAKILKQFHQKMSEIFFKIKNKSKLRRQPTTVHHRPLNARTIFIQETNKLDVSLPPFRLI